MSKEKYIIESRRKIPNKDGSNSIITPILSDTKDDIILDHIIVSNMKSMHWIIDMEIHDESGFCNVNSFSFAAMHNGSYSNPPDDVDWIIEDELGFKFNNYFGNHFYVKLSNDKQKMQLMFSTVPRLTRG